MSGIAGFLQLDGSLAQPGAMQAMLATLVRRGPDHQGLYCEGGVALGQALLATTPEALAEQQPWRHPDDACLVVSDSRLDNRPELLRELGLPQDDPDAVGDGRLLHAAWRRWGEDCAPRLLGDFAFAIWDPTRQALYCARDTAGVRPLYYHHAPGRLFAFASDMRALLALPGVPADMDETRLLEGLLPQLQALDDTGTVYPAIRRCAPAHSLLLEGGRLRLREYWTPVARLPASLPASEGEWAEGLREHFERAVRCRLRRHGAVGSMLSGGLDSSSVVAVASLVLADAGSERLHSFSAISAEADCPETTAIRCMIAAFPVQASCVDVQQASGLLDEIVRGWKGLSQPSDALMAMVDCQYRMAAAQGCRIVFDGNNADGLLFEGMHLAELLRHGRWSSALAEARGQAAFYREGWNAWDYLKPAVVEAFLPGPIRRGIRRLRQPGLIRRHLRESMVSPASAKRLRLPEALQGLAGRAVRPVAASEDGRGQSWLMSSHGIAGMERYGRLAAAQGVETRHPFMDRRLVEFCAWIPLRLRLCQGWPKWLLRRAFEPLLPAEIAWRRGKEHLGWRFNLGAYRRAVGFHPQLARQPSGATGLIEPGRGPLWAAGVSAGAWPEDWEARLAAMALQVWQGDETS